MNEQARFCPSCQSPQVLYSPLGVGDAQCGVCAWEGQYGDLLTHAFSSGFTNPDEILKSFANDVRMLLARNGVGIELGRLLLKWGFVHTVDTTTLKRFLTAVARGIASAVVAERMAMEKEKLNAS